MALSFTNTDTLIYRIKQIMSTSRAEYIIVTKRKKKRTGNVSYLRHSMELLTVNNDGEKYHNYGPVFSSFYLFKIFPYLVIFSTGKKKKI